MGMNAALVCGTFCLLYCLLVSEGSFIKPNNVPRVGRSNEADGPYGEREMGYVIKTIPNKNIPRMGRRNYDSPNRYDIPKLYEAPSDNVAQYADGQLESYFGNQYENMRR